MRLASFILATAAAFALASPALAHQSIYSAHLDGPSEAPPNASPGTGTAIVTIDFDLVTMRVQASFKDLIDNITNSHIHCCTAAPGTGTAGVATTTPTFPGFPAGGTSGVYDRTFDMTLASSYNAAFITANGGTVSSAFNALVAGIDGGKAYFNIHSSAFGGGEIRGFLTPVPEPETYALMLAGLLGLACATRRRGA